MSETLWSAQDGELGQVWEAAVAASGGVFRDAVTTYLDVQPGGTTVAAEVDAVWPDRGRATETFAASTSRRARGALRMSDGVREIGVWRFPHDPALPGLARACDASRIRALLEGLGVDVSEARLSMHAYRPLRRAVIEVRTPSASIFVKALRPDRVEGVHLLHRAASGTRMPESLGWTDDGLLVLAGLGGRSLRDVLLEGDPSGIDPAEFVEVLGELPAEFVARGTRPGWGEKARHYAEVVSAILPSAGPTAHAIAEAVSVPTDSPQVPVHGDFYETQLLITGTSVTGLLDIDTAGAGDPYDDPACLLGHLAVLAQLRPDRAHVIEEFAARCLAEFERRLDPEPLRARVAAVVLSLATGAHRVADTDWPAVLRARLALAVHWCPGTSAAA
ncbi:phosphotransferase [Actinocorallia sp. A-T 12471]|uniref:phosphotransferase n=1 Tax=Actinocorallia sp. A-T 12471 TaxID=3089813 RepID=UPI0029CEA25C|nr:phosphotransferase [Actinocorallia sp. A-T 12471]MDX6738449.1 phosphotransferase [Actinocorallia sp. A-T 12471]